MSADNILVITKVGTKIKVFDCSFSDVGCHPLWGTGLRKATVQLTEYIAKSYQPVYECSNLEAAETFCLNYMRENVVEYDYTTLW